MDSPRRHALITGASGFIGGALARAWLAEGHAVRALCRSALPATLDGAEPFLGDLCDPASLAGIEEGIDVVVHAAALLGKWGTPEREIRAVNVDGTMNLLRRFSGRGETRFVHLSAGGVTGPVDRRVVDESYAPQPATAYERTKWEAERWILEHAPALGVSATVVRPTFTYGPGDPHKLALFRAVRRGRFAFIGDGESVLHPVYLDDLLAGIALAVRHGRAGETYIVGGEHPVSKNELIGTIAAALGVPVPRLHLPRAMANAAAALLEGIGHVTGIEPILTRSRVMMMGDNFGYSIHRAREQLGYAPMTALSRGIRLTVDAYAEGGLL